MNNYNLYEEIGHGKFTTVYKGRKRYTIRYVAVKSIEKSRREKVMVEVCVLSQLSHANIVGFCNWYETRNHLWIVLEYCAGGDLLRLLKQDGRLPEDQVRRFTRDIVAGLLHVHARSLLYSDLKPANVLFNEEGILKLGDFGHSQRLEDLHRAVEEKTVLPRRGTPHYWAPELFHGGGMHSFASDFWSLACVMYEMLNGKPPFHCSSFQQLQQAVLQEPTPIAMGAPPELQALLAALLQKGPLDRISWSALRAHGFWQGRVPGDECDFGALPLQPHLGELLRFWNQLSGAGSMSGPRADSHVATPPVAGNGAATPETPLDSIAQRQDKRADPKGAFQDTGEPEAEVEPAHGSPAAEAAAAATAAAAAAQAVAAQAAAAAVAAAGLPGSLRSTLGQVTLARVRELVILADTGVRPISRNPQIEEPEVLETPPDLPFTALKLSEVCSIPHADFEMFLTKIYKCIAQGSLDQKLGALKYLEQICCHMQVADLVVNSSLLRLVLRMLQARSKGNGAGSTSTAAAAVPSLRLRLLSVIGQLLRHATHLETDVIEFGLFDVLFEGLNDVDASIRRRAAAAFGELLFYIATQPAVAAAGAGHAQARAWQVPDELLKALIQSLVAPRGDEVTQHYAVKTIENIATQSPTSAQQWFFSADLLRALAHHAKHSAHDPFRLSCLAAVALLLRGRPEALSMDQPEFTNPDLLAVGLVELAPLGIPQGLQLVAALLLRATGLNALAGALPQDIVGLLVGVASQPRYSGSIRGRATLLLSMLFALESPQEALHIREAFDSSIVPHIDRLGREKDPFVVQCVAAVVSVMDVVVVSVLQRLVEGLRQICVTSIEEPAATEGVATVLVQLCPVFLHLASSVALSDCVLGSRALPLLGAACELTARAPQQLPPHPQAAHHRGLQGSSAVQQLQPLVLSVVEALSAQQAAMLEHAPQIVRCILPALAVFLSNNKSDVRLLAMKSFTGICVMFLNDGHVFDPTAEKPSETTLLLEALLCGRTLPVIPRILDDNPPAPSYALRLFATLLSRGSHAASAGVRELGIIPQLLLVLSGQQTLTLHAALLVFCLLQSRDVEIRDLQEHGMLRMVHVALREAAEGASGHLVQIDFSLLDAALGVTEEVLAQCVAALRIAPVGAPGRDLKQLVLVDMGPLVAGLPILAALCPALAYARLTVLLDRTTACCQYLADVERFFEDRRQVIPDFGAKGALALLEALTAVAQWRQQPHAHDPAAICLQHRLLLALRWAVTGNIGAEVRAELASGVEQLLRERLIGDNAAVAADARCLISAAVSRGTQ